MENRTKIAIVVSHPIQHFCPQYASFSKNSAVRVKVFFASSLGHKAYHDEKFGKSIVWKNLRLEEFEHEFLNEGKVLAADRKLDAPGLEEKLAHFNPDLVIIYGYFQKVLRRAHRWARKNNIPLAHISDNEIRSKSDLPRWLKYFYVKWFFRRIDIFLTVGNANEEYYAYYGVPASKFVRMHFPIDIRLYEQSFKAKEDLNKSIRTKYNIGSEEIILSVAGKLVPLKSQGNIIDAMILLERKGLKVNLIILGSGEMMESCVNKAKNLKFSKVFFPGFVDPENLPAYHAATDIYVCPAEKEPHSLSISETIYMGNPVIISDKCGSWGDFDDVQPGKNGIVFHFGNIKELSYLIESLAIDVAKRKSLGEASHRIAVSNQHKSHQLILDEVVQRLKSIRK